MATKQIEIEKLLDTKATADLLGIEPQSLARWRMTGKGPRYIRVGPGAIRYAPRDVQRYIEANASAGAPVPSIA